MNVLSLKTFYSQRLDEAYQSTPLELIVHSSLLGSPIDGSLIEQAIACPSELHQGSPWILLERWRETLDLLLIVHERDLLPAYRHLFMERVDWLRREPLWPEFQLLSVYQAIVAILMECPVKPVTRIQSTSGACPMEGGNHWQWSEMPYPVLHAELGVLWCFYAYLTGQTNYLKSAERLAEWQLNALDHRFSPFTGLFASEEEGAADALLINNFILFDAISRACNREDMAFAADRQLEQLSELFRDNRIRVSPHSVMLESRLTVQPRPVLLTEKMPAGCFQDRDLALAGCRLADKSAVSTLFGGGSGMGCFHSQDVHVVSYGPQHLPLGDCRGFGLEGGLHLLGSYLRSISATAEQYSVEGVARMVSRPRVNAEAVQFRHGDPGGFWIDVWQKFEKGNLSIETAFHGLFEISTLAFVFFVKAALCLVDGKMNVKPRSFDRYLGEVCTIRFQGAETTLTLEGCRKAKEMHVIPLGGGENFWGADFLVAYSFCNEQKRYCWQLFS